MVKLASARESRLYGPWTSRNQAEYVNAGVYMFGSVVLLCGYASQLTREAKSGLVLFLIGLAVITAVNLHDMIAHFAGIDYRFRLMEFDLQLGLVEFAVPFVQAIGCLLMFVAILFLLLQEEKGYGYYKLEPHALNMLVAGPLLWVLGSIHNSCQIYERADSHVQILQQSVHIPFLTSSLIFLVGAILNAHEQCGTWHHGTSLLGKNWIWFGIIGTLLLILGGFANVVKVFKMQQNNNLRLEKLRGGAHERLLRDRDGQVPLMIDEQQRRWKQPVVAVEAVEEPRPKTVTIQSTPYKDVLIGQSPS